VYNWLSNIYVLFWMRRHTSTFNSPKFRIRYSNLCSFRANWMVLDKAQDQNKSQKWLRK